MKNLVNKCATCLEEGQETKSVGYLDGEAYCQTHLAAIDGVAQHYGLKIAPEDEALEAAAEKAMTPAVKEGNPIKNLPALIPPAPDDTQSVVNVLGHVMRGVLDGSYTARQANAICNLSSTALRAVELDWKMKRSKEVSYIVKQLEK